MVNTETYIQVPVVVKMSLNWKKPERCTSATNCVEVLTAMDFIYLRNSEVPNRVLFIKPAAWKEFIQTVKEGYYD